MEATSFNSLLPVKIAIVFRIPSGTDETFLVAGVPAESALACAIVLHAVTQVILLVLGVVSLGRLGVSRRELAARLEAG